MDDDIRLPQQWGSLVDDRGRLRLRNPARPWALLGLAVGAAVTAGCALAGRGGTVASGVLQLVLALGVVVAVVGFLVSLLLGGRGRRTAARGLGMALAALLALLVLGVAALALDLGLSRS